MIQVETKTININIIQVDAPTKDAQEELIEQFYEQLEQIISNLKRKDATIIMGDLNAKIGPRKYEDIIGQYGLVTRNDRGDLFARFCLEKEMVITNTFFKLPKRRLYTWKSPADTPVKIVRNQIDDITINRRFRNIVKSVKTFPGADVPTDQILVLASIRLKFKKIKQGRKTCKENKPRKI